jgi:hypothetical protein
VSVRRNLVQAKAVANTLVDVSKPGDFLLARLLPLLATTTACGFDVARSFPHKAATMMPAATSDLARRRKPRTTAALEELLQRIEGEYREMPGLSVTAPQAERLWGLDSTTCAFLLMTLIRLGILKRTASGTYIRG